MSKTSAITRKQMESALQEQGAQLQLFIEHAPAALAMFDRQMRYLTASRRWVSDYGLEGHTLVGQSHYDIFPEIPEAWREAHRRGLAGEVLRSEGDLFLRADGSRQWVRWEIRPWHRGTGEIGGIVIFAEDITEQRQAAEALRDSEECFRLAAGAARAMVYDVDFRTMTVKALHGLEELLGFSKSELEFTGDWWLPLIHPDDLPACRAALQELKARPRDSRIHCRLRHKDGRFLQVESHATPICDSGGEVVRIVGTILDITERVLAEQSLRQSQQRLALALDGGRMGMWEWDLVANESVWNDMEYRLLGLPPGSSRTPAEVFLRHVHPEDLAGLQSSLERAVAERSNWEHEFRIRRADGEERWLAGSGRVMLNEQGAPERVVGVNYDITERKMLEQAQKSINQDLEARVRTRTAELRAINQELETFCYSVTHELGAPLRSMNCFSNILLEECSDALDPDGRNYLERIAASAARMGHLVEDLLMLSRVTRRKPVRERVDLSRLARDIVEQLRLQEPGRRVEVAIPDGVAGEWDPALAKLALQNLLSNAWKYTGKKDSPRIEFGSLTVRGEEVYFVRDNGIGFEMAYVDKIFLPFERLHRIGEYEGTGIGLATVQRVIAMHGGRIWAEAKVGEGATFYFTAGTRTA